MSNHAVELLREAVKEGATLGDFLTLYSEKNTDEDLAHIQKARNDIACDGEIEIDDNSVCSGPEDGSGAYVLAWIWVDGDN